MWKSVGDLCAMTNLNCWDQIKQHLATQLSWESFQNWLTQTSFSREQGGFVWVNVPNAATKEWMEKEYCEQVRTAIQNLGLPVTSVIYELPSGPGYVESTTSSVMPAEAIFATPTSQLNPRYTFQNFVVGTCNQFAHAAAKAVADIPARTYNPLFIYGGVGMGKTHLMHAIGLYLLKMHGNMRIVYTTSERFMNQMITCIRNDRMTMFHQHYRCADVLLVDDIQVLSGKERTQDEFFHTFNELYDHQKQIVISSDTPPKGTLGLVERLRSRFEWGLMVDVQAPDLETKMAILDKKAGLEGIHLPEDVRIFIATRTKSNVRELEGALIKLIAYSSVAGAPISLDMAKQVLRHLNGTQDRKITIDGIIRAVAERFSLQPAQLKQKSNARHITYPRQIAMFLAKELTSASLPEIGRSFGGKHHTTVLHAVQKIDRLRQADPDLNRQVQSMMDTLN